MKLAITSDGMMRSTKTTGICLILVFLAVTIKDKQIWQSKRGKKRVKFVLFKKLIIWDGQLSILWEGHHPDRQGVT